MPLCHFVGCQSLHSINKCLFDDHIVWGYLIAGDLDFQTVSGFDLVIEQTMEIIWE